MLQFTELCNRGIDRIVEKVGGHPLALARVGSYIDETTTSVDDCFQKHEESLKTLHNDKQRSCKTSIISTYTISYEHEQRIDTSAIKLFDLFAHLDPSGRCYSLFTPIRKRTIAKDILPTWFSSSVKSRIRFYIEIQKLLDYSLIKPRYEIPACAIHPIIHDWYFRLTRASGDDIASLATSVISSAWFLVDDSTDWLHRRRLVDHCSHLHFCIAKNPKCFAKKSRWKAMICFSYSSFGNFTSTHGRMKESEEIYLRALTKIQDGWGCRCIDLQDNQQLGTFIRQGKETWKKPKKYICERWQVRKT